MTLRYLLAAVACLPAVTFAQTSIISDCPDWTSSRPRNAEGVDVCQLPSEILVDRTLTADKVWFMAGRVTVGNGNQEMSVTPGVLENSSDVVNAELTIEAGTQIIGQTGSFANLVITRGSRIMAEGTADAPIVFSSADAGFDGESEWGGVIVQGYGLHNECLLDNEGVVPCNIDTEGESGFSGGYDNTDDSGVLSYVVIAESGFEFSPGNEINALSLASVGSSTRVDHIQIQDSSDDGIEFYGGAVNARYLVITGATDDSLDWDEGYQGNIQYVLIVEDSLKDGNVLEGDTEGTTLFDSLPVIANLTAVADGLQDELVVFKKSSGGYLLNSALTIVDGNTDLVNCFNVDGFGAENNISEGTLGLRNVIADCPAFGKDATDATLANSTVQSVDPQLDDATLAVGAAAGANVPLDIAGFATAFPASVVDTSFFEATD